MDCLKCISSSKFLLFAAILLLFSSCTGIENERKLKKFVSRMNAQENACAATYLYPEDRLQFAFFANEVRKKVSNAFVEIENIEGADDYIVATFRWKNANNFLRTYFTNIGKPLNNVDEVTDTIYLKETIDGEYLSFFWSNPELDTEKLRMASIKEEKVERMNIRSGAGTGYRIIGKLEKCDDLLIEDQGKDWSRCYQVNAEGSLMKGYIYTANMSIEESAFFSLGVFESLGLLAALGILLVICIPFFFLSGVINSLVRSSSSGCLLSIVAFLALLYVLYQLVEKILFEMFIINLPY